MLLWLQIQNLSNSILRKNVMVAPNTFDKAQPLQKIAQAIELNVLVRCSAENPIDKLGVRRHSDNVTQETLLVHVSAQRPAAERPRAAQAAPIVSTMNHLRGSSGCSASLGVYRNWENLL